MKQVTKKNKKKSIVFSGIQPSGELTIGNYIGALLPWKKIQHQYDCIYCIVDQHAVTSYQDPKKLKNQTFDTLALFLACGIDFKKNIIFIQSHVPCHAQLNWILNCYSYFGELSRMTQFKNKLNSKKNVNVGLFNYPILMASDILLYQTSYVPTGIDQKQHIELTRNIAQRFNAIYGKIFTIPNPLITLRGNKIMSLQNPHQKMSKSDNNKKNVITLLENPEIAIQKIQCAITDIEEFPKIYYDIKNKPGISNLINIFSEITNTPIFEVEKQFKNKKYIDLKENLSKSISKILTKIQYRFHKFQKNKKLLNEIIFNGAQQAKRIAQKTLLKVYDAIGFYPKK